MAKKTHKITLRPIEGQRRWFSSQCGYARVAYNYALSEYRKDNNLTWKKLNTRFNSEKYNKYEWAKDQDQRAGLFGIKHFGDAITRWKGKSSYEKKNVFKSDVVNCFNVSVYGTHLRRI